MPSLGITAAAWLALSLFDAAAAQTVRANQYIVEWSAGSSALRARDSLASKSGINVRKTYNSPLFSGASIETDTFDLDALNALPEVANVWANHIYKLAPLAAQAANADSYKQLDDVVHNTTGVAKLHEAGILGAGALLDVVDTGAWYEHPAVS